MTEAGSQDWRAKYLGLVEQQEQQEKSNSELLEQLRRTLVRVSLAADGLDPELDKVLAALREHLKSNMRHNLNNRLEVVEAAVLAFDERKQQQQAQTLRTLESLAAQLQRLNLKKSINGQLKKFNASLKSRVNHFQELPQLLSELSQLQGDTLNELEIKKPGLFEKFSEFKTKRSSKPDAAIEEPALEPAGQSQLLADITQILKQLLHDLAPIETIKVEWESLRELVSGDLQWPHVLQALQTLAGVVAQLQLSANEEFGRYLLSVNKELESICQLAAHAAGDAETEAAEREQLQQQVNTQIRAIESCVNSATDLEQLKSEVTDHIKTIRASLAKPGVKKTSLSEQVKQLLNQVENLEKEAQQTYVSLSEQKQKARHDTLTGLPNREAYQERSLLEFQRWQRYQHPLSMAVVDIDFFKKINDGFGHQVGDKVLKLVSARMRKRLREVDFIARFGGEEFVILLPQTPANAALQLMDKLREAIGSTPFHYKKQPVKITVSMGVSEFRAEDTLEGVFARADKALYNAKENGRNRVESL